MESTAIKNNFKEKANSSLESVRLCPLNMILKKSMENLNLLLPLSFRRVLTPHLQLLS